MYSYAEPSSVSCSPPRVARGVDHEAAVARRHQPPQRGSPRRRGVDHGLGGAKVEAKARQDGLDQTEGLVRRRAAMERRLLIEFLQQREQAGPFCRCGGTADERRRVDREYADRVRAEMGLERVDHGA